MHLWDLDHERLCKSGDPLCYCKRDGCRWYHAGSPELVHDLRWRWAVNIDYDEFHPESYRSLEFYVSKDQPPFRFATGEVIRDYNAAVALADCHGMVLVRTGHFIGDSTFNRPVPTGGVVIEETTGLMRPARPNEYDYPDPDDE